MPAVSGAVIMVDCESLTSCVSGKVMGLLIECIFFAGHVQFLLLNRIVFVKVLELYSYVLNA